MVGSLFEDWFPYLKVTVTTHHTRMDKLMNKSTTTPQIGMNTVIVRELGQGQDYLS